MDLDETCINKGRVNSIVTCAGSLLFLGAGVTCRTGGHAGTRYFWCLRPTADDPNGHQSLAYRKDCIEKHIPATDPLAPWMG